MTLRMPSARSIAVGVTMGMLVACGVVGSPVPPESVGVNAIIQQQKKQEKLESEQRDAAVEGGLAELTQDPMLQGQDVNLPPLRPVGTR